MAKSQANRKTLPHHDAGEPNAILIVVCGIGRYSIRAVTRKSAEVRRGMQALEKRTGQ